MINILIGLALASIATIFAWLFICVLSGVLLWICKVVQGTLSNLDQELAEAHWDQGGGQND